MKILHFANWHSTNIGNGALIHGTERVLHDDIDSSIEFVSEAWDDYTFGLKKWDQVFVDLVNRHDAIVVNGAVTFNAFRRHNVHTGTRFDLPLPLWDAIQKPIILYGLSYRCWPFQKYPNKKAFRKFLAYVCANPHRIFFGVRNDGTKEWIQRTFGFESPHVHEVPDPGLFVPHANHEYPELDPKRKNIIVAFNGEDPAYRFATSTQKLFWPRGLNIFNQSTLERICSYTGGYKKKRSAVIEEIVRAAELILKHCPNAGFILAPHYLDDYGLIQEFVEKVEERLAHQRTVTTGLLQVPHTSYFYGRYAKADLVVAMRVHSMSPSIGLGTPVIPVTSQGRMRVFLKKAGLEHIAVDVTCKDFGERIAEKALQLLDAPEQHTKDLRAAADRLREQSRLVNRKIASML